MGLLDQLEEAPQDRQIFGVVLGARTSGKTTIAATLPGNTLVLMASVKESGAASARKKATQLGNNLTFATFANEKELLEYLQELYNDPRYDHVYIDGITAITNQLVEDPETIRIMKKDNWAAFRAVGERAKMILEKAKALTYPNAVGKARSVWFTGALDIKYDADGRPTEAKLVGKGQVAKSEVIGLADAVVTCLHPQAGEDGALGEHRLLTTSAGVHQGRIDGVLAADNPQIIEPASLAEVIALRDAE